MQSDKDKSDALLALLYPKVYPMLVNYARYAGISDAVAQELAQDAFALACAKSSNFASSPNPTGWLIIAERNIISNYRRSCAAWNDLLLPAEPETVDACAATSDHIGIRTLYSGIIPDDELDMICRIELDGWTYKQLAADLGVSVAAARKRVQRAEINFKNKCPKNEAETHSIKGGTNHVE